MIKILTHRKVENGRNVAFIVQNMKRHGDSPNKFYGVSQEPKEMTTEQIVAGINAPNLLERQECYTKDADGQDSIVTAQGEGSTVVTPYLYSKANDGKTDNIDSLPTYTDSDNGTRK